MVNYQNEYNRWLDSPALSDKEREELVSIGSDEGLKEFRFSNPMDFGTAGLRSTMYQGIGNMNRFTVAQTTRGIAALIKAQCGESRGVAIAYDSRNNSREFARISACVLAGAGIKSYIFNGLRPTPELSYAVRETGALAGINITASHNPKEYNGYKAYWEDGAQLAPEHASAHARELLGVITGVVCDSDAAGLTALCLNKRSYTASGVGYGKSVHTADTHIHSRTKSCRAEAHRRSKA